MLRCVPGYKIYVIMTKNNITRTLYRPIRGRVFAGVLAGFAKYFNLDIVLLRVLFVFFVLLTGFFPGVVGYVLAIFIIPEGNVLDHDDIIFH